MGEFCPYCGSKLIDKDKFKSEIDRLKFKEKLGIVLMISCDLIALPFIIMSQNDASFFMAIIVATAFSAVSLHYNRLRAKLEEVYNKVSNWNFGACCDKTLTNFHVLRLFGPIFTSLQMTCLL